MIRALHHRNFSLFFMGQSISLVGTWMQRMALSWLVYRMTNSPFLLGVVGFSGQIASFFLAPYAGVMADRLNRHKVLIITQATAMVQALILAILVLTGSIHIWQIIALSVLLGMINGFDIPTRQSFMIQMVEDKNDLGNAIALNSSMFNGARLIGPSLAGILIAVFGEGMCFLLNALSYIAVIWSLLAMKINKVPARHKKKKVWYEMKEGFRYAAGFAPIRALLLMLALVSLMGMPYVILMPVFAKDILHGGPDALGFLMGSTGIGALVGAVYLASRNSVLGLGKLIPISVIILGLGLCSFSLSNILLLSLFLMLFTGLGQMVQMATSNTLLQTLADEDKRGRVMSFYAMAFMGASTLGSLIAGVMAQVIGVQWTVFIGGLACIGGAIVFARKLPALREKVHPIYVRMGIIPEIANGIQRATEMSATDYESDRPKKEF